MVETYYPKKFKTNYCQYYLLSDIKKLLSEKELDKFNRWLTKQFLLGIADDDNDYGVFSWDYEEFIKQL
jgi:hypothetical protein